MVNPKRRARRCRPAILVFTLSLNFLLAANLLAREKKKDKHTVRIYELSATVTALHEGTLPECGRRVDSATPHQVLVIQAKITNGGKQFPCTRLEPFLEVRPYYPYHLDWADSPSLPNLEELLPG